MQINISNYIVRNVDGTLNIQETMESISFQVITLVEQMDEDTREIAKAVHTVFDTFKGSRLTTNAVVSFALQNLTVTPESAGEITGKITEYLKQNTGEKGKSLFCSKRGRGGGVSRWNDTSED